MAEICGLNKRTLARKLQVHGTSVQKELTALRQARAELERSLSILEDVDSPYQVARTGIVLAAVCAAQGAPAQADRLRREAIVTFERLGAELDLSRAKEDRR